MTKAPPNPPVLSRLSRSISRDQPLGLVEASLADRVPGQQGARLDGVVGGVERVEHRDGRPGVHGGLGAVAELGVEAADHRVHHRAGPGAVRVVDQGQPAGRLLEGALGVAVVLQEVGRQQAGEGHRGLVVALLEVDLPEPRQPVLRVVAAPGRRGRRPAPWPAARRRRRRTSPGAPGRPASRRSRPPRCSSATSAAAMTAASTSSGAGSQPVSASSTAAAIAITRVFSPLIVQ